MNYEHHPYTDIFPYLGINNNIVNQIKAESLLNPIILHKDKIVEGRLRSGWGRA